MCGSPLVITSRASNLTLKTVEGEPPQDDCRGVQAVGGLIDTEHNTPPVEMVIGVIDQIGEGGAHGSAGRGERALGVIDAVQHRVGLELFGR
jgi:hypothetical protein